MVRLNDIWGPNYRTIWMFQFLHGAIECCCKKVLYALSIKFQFLYGAIECSKNTKLFNNSNLVSIPLWCDWMMLLYEKK